MAEDAPSQKARAQTQLMQMAMGFSAPFLLRVAAQLNLADHLADGAQTAADLAEVTGTNASALYRVLRTLASIGIFKEDQFRRFEMTDLAKPLQSTVPGSVRNAILSITGDLFIIPWSKLLYAVQTGHPSFDHSFGVPFFDQLGKDPEEAGLFFDLLIGINGADAPAVAAAYDFSAFKTIADIGGATGHILTTILAAHPGPRGTLFDVPDNQAPATELIHARGMTDRVTFVPGSFFETIPSGSDLYILSHILHDWSEEQCHAILANCHRAMVAGSRLLILEMVLPEGNSFHPGKILDMTMLATTTGQERTEYEYRALLGKAGFKLNRVIPTSSAISIIEAFPA